MATPAAVLSVLVKADGILKTNRQIQGIHGDMDKAGKAAGKWKGRMAGAAKVAGAGMAAGIGLGVVAVKGFVTAAAESEKSNARMRAQLKASGISFAKHGDHINEVIARHSKLSAFDDEDLQDSFTNIVRVTGDVNKALRLNALAADFARAKGIDVAKAGELIGKVAGGNIGILSRYGIQMKEGATATEALGVLQQKFAGQAKAYGDTAAGANDRFKVAVENLQEAIGARLLPVIAKVMNAVSGFVNSLTEGSGATGGFGRVVGDVFEKVQSAVGTAVGFLRGQFNTHRDDLANVGRAVRNVGIAIREVWEHVALPIIQRVLPAIVTIIRGAFNIIGGLIKVLSSLLTGDFGDAWDGVKQIFRGALQIIGGIIRAATAPIREAVAKVGDAVGDAFSASWERVRNGVGRLIDWVKEAGGRLVDRFADGIRGAGSVLTDAAKWLKDKIVGEIKDFLGIDSPSKVFMEIGGHMIDGLIKGMSAKDVTGFIKKHLGGVTGLATSLFGGIVGGGAGIGHMSGTWKIARLIASKFGLTIGSNYRTPEHNAAVGGVPNSLHTHGSPSNPGAFDMSGSVAAMNAAAAWIKQNLNVAEVLVHDVGSGLHLHVGFFKQGGYARGLGIVGEAGPELVNFGARGAQVYSNSDSRAMLSGTSGPLVHIEHMDVHSGFETRTFAADLAWRLQTA